jgi:hypothetical protein
MLSCAVGWPMRNGDQWSDSHCVATSWKLPQAGIIGGSLAVLRGCGYHFAEQAQDTAIRFAQGALQEMGPIRRGKLNLGNLYTSSGVQRNVGQMGRI